MCPGATMPLERGRIINNFVSGPSWPSLSSRKLRGLLLVPCLHQLREVPADECVARAVGVDDLVGFQLLHGELLRDAVLHGDHSLGALRDDHSPLPLRRLARQGDLRVERTSFEAAPNNVSRHLSTCQAAVFT